MTDQEAWEGKNILKIKSDELKTIKVIQDTGELYENEQTPDELRKEIEPWLTALFQCEHLSLLVGAGLSYAVHDMAAGKLPDGMSTIEFSVFDEQIGKAAEESAKKSGRGEANIEDQIRVANDLIKGMEIYLSSDPYGGKKLRKELDKFKTELVEGIGAFARDVLQTERNIVTANNIEAAVDYLTSFLVSFSSRTAQRERLNLFTTNYDRIIEFGSELAGVRLIDRFVGNINPVFRSSRLRVDMHYNPPGIRGEPRYLEGVVHFTKLHGSLDWIDQDNVVRRFALPFGASVDIDQYYPAPGSGGSGRLMIYPNASKDRETAEYPYVDLFRDLAAAICQPNSTLVVYGYSFGDDHINRMIKDMLTIPSTHLVIIVRSDTGGRVNRFYNSVGHHAQITLLVGGHFGDLKNLVDYYLPKPAIDRTTVRMAELLKSRGLASMHQENGGD